MTDNAIYNIIILSVGVSITIGGIYWHHRSLEEAEIEESYSYTDLP